MDRTASSFLRWARLLLAALAAGLLAGCATIAHKQGVGALHDAEKPRHIAIFLDGTHNEEASDTNVKRMHALVSLQPRDDLYTLYVQGVGTGSDLLGMMTGYGFGPRVRMAYAFLLEHYRYDRGDRIYVFGFSRGAYAARVLNSLLYHAGLPEKPPAMTHAELAEAVYGSVKLEADYDAAKEPQRRRVVQEALARDGLAPARAVPVELLGLWDTVGALGLADYGSRLRHKWQIEQHEPDIDDANRRYGDKLCNVRHAFHAMSIDDNREWIFTPLPLTRRYLFDGCEKKEDSPLWADGAPDFKRLREVWFAGAHSDVGGGYADTRLSGVSLNWMLREMARAKLDIVPAGAQVPEDAFGTSHNPEAGAFAPLYHGINRNLVRYVRDPRSLVSHLKVHPSVFHRRRLVPVKHHENGQLKLRGPGSVELCQAKPEPNRLDMDGRWVEVDAANAANCKDGSRSAFEVVQDADDWRYR